MKCLLFGFLFCFPMLFHAQEIKVPNKAELYYQKGRKAFLRGDFNKAIVHFDRALKKFPNYYLAKKYKAYSFHNLEDYKTADLAYHDLLEKNPKDKDVLLQRARLKRTIQQFDQAIQLYQQYAALEEDATKIQNTTSTINNLLFIIKATRNPVDFTPELLPTSINSQNSEYLPALSADGNQLIFTRRINRQEDFYQSVKSNGTWQESSPIESLNTAGNEGAFCILPDAKWIIFTACNRRDSYGGCDLYISQFKNGAWVKPKNLGPEINSRAKDFQPSISSDGQTLVFCSNRKGGKGKTDIWISEKKDDGQWSKPINMGDSINTASEDESPFIHPDGSTMYFMSKGHPGMGDFDLFLTRKGAFGQWTKPINMGYPINSPGNEGALHVAPDGETAFYASDRKYFPDPFKMRRKNEFYELDIYTFTLDSSLRALPTRIVFGRVINAKNKAGLKASVDIFDPEHPERNRSFRTDDEGKFSFPLVQGFPYGLHVGSKGYDIYSDRLYYQADVMGDSLLVIALNPIPDDQREHINRPIILQNVFFNTGSTELLNTSHTELDKLVQFLKTSPDIQIEIHGHTDDIGNDASNQILSEKRAQAVYLYLLKSGLAQSRLKYIGFGESKPISHNNTESGRSKNRRVEFILIK